MTTPPHASGRVRKIAWTCCAILWVLAFAATHIPLQRIPKLPGGDEFLHLAGFAVLTVVYGFALAAQGVAFRRRVVVTVVTMVLYAMLDETTQPLVNRHAHVSDWLADSAGALVGSGVLELAIKVWRRTTRNNQ